MFKFILILSLVVLPLQLACQSPEDSVKGGYTKCMAYDTLFAYVDSSFKNFPSQFLYEYNGSGKVIERRNHYSDNSYGSIGYYRYDSVGNLESRLSLNPRGLLIFESEYTYDSHRNIIHTLSSWDLGPVVDDREYDYDEQGRILREKIIAFGSFEIAVNEYFYDQTGNLFKINQYDWKGTLTNLTLSKFDNNNRIIEKLKILPDSTVCTKETYKYDDKNNIIEKTILDNDGSVFYNRDKSVFYKYAYLHDEYGNITEEIRYDDKNDAVSKITYIYSK